MRILILQNFQLTPFGVIGEVIQERGGTITILMPAQGDILTSNTTDFDGLIILGGPMNAEDDESFPWLQDLIALINQFYEERKPILGSCLGAQIIARAFGQRIYRNDVPEVGFSPVFLTDACIEESWLKGFPLELHLMQWHFDTFDLPNEAKLLMYGKTCRHQAYKIGENIYGFQFHLEVTKEILQNWIETKDSFIEKNYPDLSEKLTKQMEKYLEISELFCRQFTNAWLDLVEI